MIDAFYILQRISDFLCPFHIPGSHINLSTFLCALFYNGKPDTPGGCGYQNDFIMQSHVNSPL